MLGDVDNQTQIRSHHAFASRGILVMDDAASELLLLVGREKRRLVDLTQVQLQTRLDGSAGHVVVTQVKFLERATERTLHPPQLFRPVTGAGSRNLLRVHSSVVSVR